MARSLQELISLSRNRQAGTTYQGGALNPAANYLGPLQERFPGQRIGGGPGENLPLNAAIGDYIQAIQENRRVRDGGKRVRDLSGVLSQVEPGAFPGLEAEYVEAAGEALGPQAAISLGQQIAEAISSRRAAQDRSAAVGMMAGARNAPIKEGPASFRVSPGGVQKARSFENVSTQTPGQPSLADFIRNPALGAMAEKGIETERKATQDLIKENLKQKNKIEIENLKAELKKKNYKNIVDIPFGDRIKLINLEYPEGEVDEAALAQFFPEIYGQQEAKPKAAASVDLTPEEAEVMEARKKRNQGK